jgi:hypothetical protein
MKKPTEPNFAAAGNLSQKFREDFYIVYIGLNNSILQSVLRHWHISCLASQENSCFLWNPKVQYCVHKGLTLYSILSQLNQVHTFISYLFNIHFNIILHLCQSFSMVCACISHLTYLCYICHPSLPPSETIWQFVTWQYFMVRCC